MDRISFQNGFLAGLTVPNILVLEQGTLKDEAEAEKKCSAHFHLNKTAAMPIPDSGRVTAFRPLVIFLVNSHLMVLTKSVQISSTFDPFKEAETK